MGVFPIETGDYVRRLFTHLDGVLIAHARSAAKCGKFAPIPRKGTRENGPLAVGNTAEDGELVRSAVEHVFGARTIVAADVHCRGVLSSSRDLEQPGCPPISLSV